MSAPALKLQNFRSGSGSPFGWSAVSSRGGEVGVEHEPAPVADPDTVHRDVPPVARPQDLRDGVPVEHAVQHQVGDPVPLHVLQGLAQMVGGHPVPAPLAARLDGPLPRHHRGPALPERRLDPVVLEHVLVQLVVGPALVAQDLVLGREVELIVDVAAGDVAAGLDARVLRADDRAAPERPATVVEDHAVGHHRYPANRSRPPPSPGSGSPR